MLNLSDRPDEYFCYIEKYFEDRLLQVKHEIMVMLDRAQSSIQLKYVAIVMEDAPFFPSKRILTEIFDLFERMPRPIYLYYRGFPDPLRDHNYTNVAAIYVDYISNKLLEHCDLTTIYHVTNWRPKEAIDFRRIFNHYHKINIERVQDKCTVADEFLAQPHDQLHEYLSIRRNSDQYCPKLAYELRCNRERLAYFRRIQFLLYMQRNRPHNLWSNLDRNIVTYILSFLSSRDWVGKVRLAPKNPSYVEPALKLLRKLNDRVLKEASARQKLEDSYDEHVEMHKKLLAWPETKRKMEDVLRERAKRSARDLDKYAEKRTDLLEKKRKKRRILKKEKAKKN